MGKVEEGRTGAAGETNGPQISKSGNETTAEEKYFETGRNISEGMGFWESVLGS
ncbi:hypothetical protein V9K67_21805 [Paraflavisolibacter sp. H34]|uniref:hypothetical protein n=1 Tax=Huijunlia imazamoxiresistens TaxID=3127457 RepID=UPI003018E062